MADWDFIGFTYNGKHSVRDLKIYRTSNSGRYDDNLTATMTDKTVDVPGGDGQYYFGTTFKNRTFTVPYAFDNLTESDLRIIKQTFDGEGIHDLVFDEAPYKAWAAKVTGTASMKHLCFEIDGERVYRGEGSITFTCYYPFARTPKKLWIPNYKEGEDVITHFSYEDRDGRNFKNYCDAAYPNREEWKIAADLDEYGHITIRVADAPTSTEGFSIYGLGITVNSVTQSNYYGSNPACYKRVDWDTAVTTPFQLNWNLQTGVITYYETSTEGPKKIPEEERKIISNESLPIKGFDEKWLLNHLVFKTHTTAFRALPTYYALESAYLFPSTFNRVYGAESQKWSPTPDNEGKINGGYLIKGDKSTGVKVGFTNYKNIRELTKLRLSPDVVVSLTTKITLTTSSSVVWDTNTGLITFGEITPGDSPLNQKNSVIVPYTGLGCHKFAPGTKVFPGFVSLNDKNEEKWYECFYYTIATDPGNHVLCDIDYQFIYN